VEGEPFEGGEGRDQLVELGAGRLLDEMDSGLRGAKPGEQRTIALTFPDDYQAEHLAGKTASFDVTVREVREKDLPALDDDFAAEASEFDTLDELRADISEKLGEVLAHRAEEAFRSAAVDAAAEQAEVELPGALVEARAEDMWHRMEHSLAERGVSPETYLQVTGKTREDIVAETKPDAERALRREATLAAIADAEGIEGSDEVERLVKAAELVVEHAKPIPMAQAEARERLWTPEQQAGTAEPPAPEADESAQEPGKLWTPGRDR
jgi:trigger factor